MGGINCRPGRGHIVMPDSVSENLRLSYAEVVGNVFNYIKCFSSANAEIEQLMMKEKMGKNFSELDSCLDESIDEFNSAIVCVNFACARIKSIELKLKELNNNDDDEFHYFDKMKNLLMSQSELISSLASEYGNDNAYHELSAGNLNVYIRNNCITTITEQAVQGISDVLFLLKEYSISNKLSPLTK